MAAGSTAVAPDRAFDPEPPAEGHCYYTPLTVWGDPGRSGTRRALSRVADPSELRATRSGSGLGAASSGMRVTLRWRWAAEQTPAWSSLARARPSRSERSRGDHGDRFPR